MSIWKTLSAIDCAKHVEQKGKFSYLSWTWAWAMVKEQYPSAFYLLEDDVVYPDGTMECRVTVAIPVGDEASPLAHTMWLPVLNFQNKAISNPNAFDINSTRMRCLVKCLAMFGLGHYIYAGESAPQDAASEVVGAVPDAMQLHLEAVANNMSSIQCVKECLADENYESAYEAFQEISKEDHAALWMAPTKGGKAWTTKERAQMQSNEWCAARKYFNGEAA